MLALVVAASACADEFLREGEAIRRVQVIAVAAGQVEYRMPTGAFEKAPLTDCEGFVIDSITGMADFNAAEQFALKNQPRQAVERYERAARGAQSFWSDLVQARLCQAADRAGLYEKAVRAFLAVVERDPVTAAVLMPSALPTLPDPSAERTLKRLEEAAGKAPLDSAKTLIQLLRFDLLRRLKNPGAVELAAEIVALPMPAEVVTPRAAAAIDAAFELLIGAGRGSEAVAAIGPLQGKGPRDFQIRWLLLEAQGRLVAAQSDDDYLAAALSAMRVAILHAETAASGEGLILAAEAHRRSGRVDDAARLLRECLKRDSVTEETKQKARDALAALAAGHAG
jgi:tetratricopeptide (TPR) repeat protein